MSVVGSAVRRGGLVLGPTAFGVALTVVGYLWWGTTAAALFVAIGLISGLIALGWLYRTRRPLRFRGVPLTFGVLALFALYIVGVTAARDIAMTLVGVDAEAVVERTWTTQSRGTESHHCTLRRIDGTPIPRELATNCEGYERGDTMPVVLDPGERFAPVGGPKSDLPAVGETQVAAVAALALLVSIAIGSVPQQPRTVSSRRSRR